MIENISISKIEKKAEVANAILIDIEEQTGIYLTANKISDNEIRSKILKQFKYKYQKINNNVDLDKIELHDVDKRNLKTLNTFNEFKKIYDKYINGKSADIKLKQINLGISDSIYTSRVKEIQKLTKNKYFSEYDYRKEYPLQDIKQLLIKKTEKYVPIFSHNFVYDFKTFEELAIVFKITTGIHFPNCRVLEKKHNEDYDDYSNRLNSFYPDLIEFKAFKNGNLRISLKNEDMHNNFRQYFINKELALISHMRKVY